MRSNVSPARRFFALVAGLPVAAAIFSPLSPEAVAISPRAERVADRIAERRYARMSIAETRAARAEARVAEIAPAVPVPPPPRPATVRRMARAGVPLGGPPPAVVATPAPPAARPGVAATPPAPAASAARSPSSAAADSSEPPASMAATASRTPVPEPAAGVWTLDPDPAGGPAVASDGTRSVLATGGEAPAKPADPGANAATRPGAAVTQPPIELLPTPAAN
jgi:hypothetical protein